MKEIALQIIRRAINDSLPYDNTKKLLEEMVLPDGVTVFSIGKAAVPMAQAAADVLGAKIKNGLLVTKYDHTGDFNSPFFEVIEAAHPVSDENSIRAAEKALTIADGLTAEDTAIVLLSGGGSALFEKSTVSAEMQRDVTKKLLARGAEIEEINAIRRRISLVKGGRFAARCYPAKVITIALSDVLSNDRQVIASGITVEDTATDEFVKSVADRYLYDTDDAFREMLLQKEVLRINDGGYFFAGDINSLCDGAEKAAAELGLKPVTVTRALTGEASDCAKRIIGDAEKAENGTVLIYGGETTVTLKGTGLGGRNQEMALAAAILLKDSKGLMFASAGSDGTDGPTDAAGGFADGSTYQSMLEKGINPDEYLENNDSYHALKQADSLIITGATGTNVNDITIIIKNNE